MSTTRVKAIISRLQSAAKAIQLEELETAHGHLHAAELELDIARGQLFAEITRRREARQQDWRELA